MRFVPDWLTFAIDVDNGESSEDERDVVGVSLLVIRSVAREPPPHFFQDLDALICIDDRRPLPDPWIDRYHRFAAASAIDTSSADAVGAFNLRSTCTASRFKLHTGCTFRRDRRDEIVAPTTFWARHAVGKGAGAEVPT
jgi:hypothetical protein